VQVKGCLVPEGFESDEIDLFNFHPILIVLSGRVRGQAGN
jgi:hypothetical protein